MRAIDTNVFVRLIARDDPGQTKLAEAFIEKGVWVSSVVLAEAVWVLQSVYARSPGEIAGIVERLLKHEKLTLQDSDAAASALAHFQANPALGFADCLILESARKAGHLPLGTFDRGFAKLDDVERLT